MIKNIKQWRSTILGVVGVATSILVAQGGIPEESSSAIVSHAEDIILAVSSIYLILLAKD